MKRRGAAGAASVNGLLLGAGGDNESRPGPGNMNRPAPTILLIRAPVHSDVAAEETFINLVSCSIVDSSAVNTPIRLRLRPITADMVGHRFPFAREIVVALNLEHRTYRCTH